MDPRFPSLTARWVERILRLLPLTYRVLFAAALAILAITVAASISITFTAGDDPLLKSVARYAKATLIVSTTVAVVTITAIALYRLIRSQLRDG